MRTVPKISEDTVQPKNSTCTSMGPALGFWLSRMYRRMYLDSLGVITGRSTEAAPSGLGMICGTNAEKPALQTDDQAVSAF